MNLLEQVGLPALAAVLGYIGGRLHQTRERHLRRTDLLREAYAHWAAAMDTWHDSLVCCMRANNPESNLHYKLDTYEAQLDDARSRATLYARQLQVLESDDDFLNLVYLSSAALPHVWQEAWESLQARADCGERVIVIENYKVSMDALIAELRKTQRLW